MIINIVDLAQVKEHSALDLSMSMVLFIFQLETCSEKKEIVDLKMEISSIVSSLRGKLFLLISQSI